MKKLNVILVYDKNEKNILMCKREKEPYKGKYNLVGGKVEPGENELEAAYRELEEETAITPFCRTPLYSFIHLGSPRRIKSIIG